MVLLMNILSRTSHSKQKKIYEQIGYYLSEKSVESVGIEMT